MKTRDKLRRKEITRGRGVRDGKRRRQAFQSSYMPVKSAETAHTHTHTHGEQLSIFPRPV